MRENLPIIVYFVALLLLLLVGAFLAERRAMRREHREYREAEALQRARAATSPKGR